MPAVPSPSCTLPGVRRNARSSLDSPVDPRVTSVPFVGQASSDRDLGGP